jgi:predicted aldo/keto reductase-like oxidoreductase
VGGSHLVRNNLDAGAAVKLIRAALDQGMNFLDNSWDYHDGESEKRMGKALRDGYREQAFLMTKVDGRSKEEAARQLDESLKRLEVEQVDLLQHHEIIRFDDADRIFAPGGAMEAFIAARKAGKIRYIGFTGHKDPDIHLYMLDVAKRHDFRFDTVQMPLNPFDGNFRSFEQKVLPRLVKEGIGVLGMKSMAGGVLLTTRAVTAEECLRYALTLPTSVVITGIDSPRILKQALEVSAGFEPFTEREMAKLRKKAAPMAANGEWELFKTTTVFDSTVKHPEWLGEPSKRALRLSGN